ncbi:hypothetical protein FDECE_8335 [Fusarium decemcellulare]|nr:hypothetical protein FDECE_8335 [Fusarium decemcellulare]
MSGPVEIIFQEETQPSFFESICARSNGMLLVTRQDVNELWELNPFTRTGRCVLRITEVESLTGMCEVSLDVYAVGGGTYRVKTHEGPLPGTFGVWLADLTGDEPKVHQVTRIPEIGQLNGITAWDSQTILAADSYHGKVYRVNIQDGSSSVCIEHETMTDPPKSPVRMGVNGLKIRTVDGGRELYYSNTARMLFCRIPVDCNATATGPAEVLATGFSPESMTATNPAFAALPTAVVPASEHTIKNLDSLPVPTEGFMPDDFCFDEDGSTYVTTHPTNMVMKIPPGGGSAIRIAGGFTEWEVAAATACTFGRTKEDRHVLYVTTAGANVIPIGEKSEPAKVVAIDTKAVL